MLYFDVHSHIGNLKIKFNAENKHLIGYVKYRTNTPETCMRKALSNHVAKSVVFPFPLMEHPFDRQNDYVLQAAKKYPYFFIPFVIPESIKALEEKAKDFMGIKDHFYFDFHAQVDHTKTMSFAQEWNKVYLFHAHWKYWGDRIKNIVDNFPKLKVIIAHSARQSPFSGRNFQETINELRLLIPKKMRDNFYFDTSTIRDSAAIECLVNAFGAEQILWGTDSPYCGLSENENVYQVESDVIHNSHLMPHIKKMIFEDNFRRLFQNSDIWIRHAMVSDAPVLIKILNGISEPEKKFLALDKKIKLIRNLIKSGKHFLVADDCNGTIVAFLRWSDRHENSIMIEEIYVLPEFRRLGLATRLIKSIIPMCSSAEVKTFSANVGINSTLERMDFKQRYSPKGTVITWKK